MPRRSDRTSEGSGMASGSANSSGILPTTAASRARGKARSGTAANDAAMGAAGERRFEDLMVDQTADVGELTFITEARRPAAKTASFSSASAAVKRKRPNPSEAVGQGNGAAGRAAAPRKARKTLGEEIGDEGFIFTREGRRPPTPPATDEEVGGAPASRKTSSSKRAGGIPGSMGPPPIAKPRSNARGPASSTVYSDLPDEGETPIIRRNQAFRAGLPTGNDRTTSGSSAAGPSSGGGKRARRDSLNLKATRRVSILSSGAPAHPHLDVPDWELFRHCSGTLPAEERMAHIASWLLKRGMTAALKGDDVTAAPVARAQDDKGKKKGKAAAAAPAPGPSLQPLSDDEKRHLVRAQQSLEAAMEQTLRDLTEGKVDVSWGKAGKSTGKGLQPHPRNVANASSAVRLEGVLATMRSECSAWEAERDEIEAYRQRTQELLDEVAAASSRGGGRSKVGSAQSSKTADITAPSLGAALDAVEAQWTDEDLSPAALSQLADARESLAAIAQWIKGAGGGAAAERAVAAAAQAHASEAPSETAVSKGKVRGRKSVAVTNEGLGEGGLDGTSLDPRWLEAELKTDILRSRAHPFTQLSSLSQRYISLVSGRGAETLRRMAGIRSEADLGLGGGADEEEGAASAAFGSSASGGGEGAKAGEGAAASNRESRRHVEGLLKGIRRAEALSSSATPSPAKGGRGRRAGAGKGGKGDDDAGGHHDDSGLGREDDSGVGSTSVADDSHMDLLRALASASSSH